MSAQQPQAHRVQNANEIPFKGPMNGKYPVAFEQAQALATEKKTDVYWLEGVKTAYYLAKVVDNAPEK